MGRGLGFLLSVLALSLVWGGHVVSANPGEFALPEQAGQELWMDGEGLRWYLEPSIEGTPGVLGESLSRVLSHLQGVRWVRGQDGELRVSVYLDQSMRLKVADDEGDWRLSAVLLPRATRFVVRSRDGLLHVSGLDRGPNPLKLEVLLPGLPDTVYLRNVVINLHDGTLRLEAGVLGNTLAIFADGKLAEREISKVDIRASILANLRLLAEPWFTFYSGF